MWLSKKEYTTFKKLENSLRRELNSPNDLMRSQSEAKKILGYSPYSGKF